MTKISQLLLIIDILLIIHPLLLDEFQTCECLSCSSAVSSNNLGVKFLPGKVTVNDQSQDSGYHVSKHPSTTLACPTKLYLQYTVGPTTFELG